jgi:ABC-type methionine transport system permease subunit
MPGIYTYIPWTNPVPKQYIVTAILSLLFMVPISLAAALLLLLLLLLLLFADSQHQITAYKASHEKATDVMGRASG